MVLTYRIVVNLIKMQNYCFRFLKYAQYIIHNYIMFTKPFNNIDYKQRYYNNKLKHYNVLLIRLFRCYRLTVE